MRTSAVGVLCIPIICVLAACHSPAPSEDTASPELARAVAMLHSGDPAVRRESQHEFLRIGNRPDQKPAAIRELIRILDAPAVPHRTWYGAAEMLITLHDADAIQALARHIDYSEGLADFPDGKLLVPWGLAQIGEPALGDLIAVLSRGRPGARGKAAMALGMAGGTRAEQALRQALLREKETSVISAIDDALRDIDAARLALRETTEPAAVARHCLDEDAGFMARPIRTRIVDGRSTRVNEQLCHVDNATGGVSEHGDWWVLRTTASGVHSRRIGINEFWGYSVSNFASSPDGQYLAVLSSAEGAPSIQVADLAALVERGQTRLVRELPVGLGVFSLKGWKGHTLLVASSSHFIGLPDSRIELLPSSGEQLFSWDVRSDTVTPVSAALRDPIR